jgi:hypothetical protein
MRDVQYLVYVYTIENYLSVDSKFSLYLRCNKSWSFKFLNYLKMLIYLISRVIWVNIAEESLGQN